MIAEHIQMEVEFDLEIISSELMNDSTVISKYIHFILRHT